MSEIPYADDPQHFRVACASCGSTRSSRWKECFCHETRTKKAPEVAPTPEELLREYRAPLRLDEG